MLDVHPPHQAAHTWKDFFIHIATIVIGLLIAIGLEQTVEYFHHRKEVRETREALKLELERNRRAYAVSITEFNRQSAALTNNLLVLDYIAHHPRATRAELPGILVWHAVRTGFADSAWKSAQQSNVTALMPQDEVRSISSLYALFDTANHNFDDIWPRIVHARLYAMLDPDPTHLSPDQLRQEIDDTRAALVANFTEGAALVQLARVDSGFTPTLTPQQLNQLMKIPEAEEALPALAHAIQLTRDRLPEHTIDITRPGR